MKSATAMNTRTLLLPLVLVMNLGDIAYYAPWGNLALFYKDFRYWDGLILLGKLDGGVETLSVSGSVRVTIELIK